MESEIVRNSYFIKRLNLIHDFLIKALKCVLSVTKFSIFKGVNWNIRQKHSLESNFVKITQISWFGIRNFKKVYILEKIDYKIKKFNIFKGV